MNNKLVSLRMLLVLVTASLVKTKLNSLSRVLNRLHVKR